MEKKNLDESREKFTRESIFSSTVFSVFSFYSWIFPKLELSIVRNFQARNSEIFGKRSFSRLSKKI